MSPKLTPRALQAIGELRTASETLARRASETDKAAARLLEAVGRYWGQWFPVEPTATDRAALELARIVNNAERTATTTVAGTDKAQQTTQHQK